MKVRQNRLLARLKEHGFASGPESRTSDDLIFTRPSHIPGLFESIIVGCQGKRGEAVHASVGTAVTRQVMYKVLGDVKLLEELAENQERGWTIIEDDGKAREWEGRLAQIGPLRAREWAEAGGPKVLHDTAEVRAAADRYFTLVNPTNDLAQVLSNLKQTSSKRIADEAERFHACPILSGTTGTETAYQVACYLIARHSEELEGKSVLGCNPMDDALMDRVIILANKLFNYDERYHTRSVRE